MHLDEGTIHAWLDGALDADEAARVEQHAAECAECAAAVAEARGLVAGASRILTALDGVPGGVVPKTATSGGAVGARRTRSLWTSLHLTPARAAAAAVIVLAAGTALVVRNAPNAARSAIRMAGYPADSAVTLQPAAPMVLPHAAPDTAASRTLSAPTLRAPSRKTSAEPAPKPLPATVRGAAVGEAAVGRASTVAVAEKARPAAEVVASDSLRRESSVDSAAAKKEAALARSAVADNAARGAVAGAAPRAAAAAPPSSADQRYVEMRTVAVARSTAGCYDVTTDSAIVLPRRLWLDSSLVAQPAQLQQSRAMADATVMGRRGVSESVNDARRSIAGAFWTLRPDGSIQLSLPAVGLNVDLLPASIGTLVGTAVMGDRTVLVTLRRAECGH